MTDYILGSTIYKRFTTRQFSTGAPFTLAGTPVVAAYENDSATQITAGITLGVDHDTVTGLNLLTIVATTANGFERGKEYDLVITTGTVDSVSVVGEVIGTFSIEKESATQMQRYMGPIGIGVFLDGSSGAIVGSPQVGVDGTMDNPLGQWSTAKTLMDSIGTDILYMTDPSGPSPENVSGLFNHKIVYGLGNPDAQIVDLNSQNVDGTAFYNVTIQGPQGGSLKAYFENCVLKDEFGAPVTTLHGTFVRCGIKDDITLDTSDDNMFIDCYSMVAGTGSPIFRASGASGTIQFRGQRGGIELHDLGASHNVSIEGTGQIIYDSSCNVNAAISVRGLYSVTDNTAGMANVTEDALINMTKISAAAGGSTPTEIADAVLNRDFSAVSDTNARTVLNSMRFLRNKWSVAGNTLTVTKEDDATEAWTAAVTSDAAADPITGSDPA
jgi:hypothetical protein